MFSPYELEIHIVRISLYVAVIMQAYSVVTGYIACDFESMTDSTCSFYNNGSNNVDWVRKTSSGEDSFAGPVVDNTYRSNTGHFMTIQSSFPTERGTGRVSRILSPTVVMPTTGNASNFCLTFFYHMYGPPTQSLRVYVRERGQDVSRYSHWSRQGNFGDIWNEMSMNISITDGFQIAFEGSTSSTYYGDISLDDIKCTLGTCKPRNSSANTTSIPATSPTTPLNRFICNLNNINVCGFTRHQRNAFDWKWSGNTTQTNVWGPLGDHTLGSSSGFYFFVTRDAANQQQEQRSRIVSPLFTRNAAHKCLRFYLYMNGNSVGRLNAYVVREGYTPPLDPTRSYNKSLGNVWSRAFIDIAPQQSNFKVNLHHRCFHDVVKISGEHRQCMHDHDALGMYHKCIGKASAMNSRCLDDTMKVSVMEPVMEIDLAEGVIFEVIRGTNFDGSIAVDDFELSDHICPRVNATNDFESGLGDFIQDTTDTMNWLMKGGQTASRYTGPNADHTKGDSSGKFLYIETSYYYWSNNDDVARLYSPVLLATTELPRCLTFWYHMYGKDIESLTVYMVNSTNPFASNKTELWTMSGNRGNRWRGAEVHLNSSQDFQIVFEAAQGGGYQGDIAIDDIKIEADVCPGEHHFHNYSSITCNFEESELCYYKQEKTDDDIDWMWINGDFTAQRVPTGPSTDHTTGNELGFYLFIGYENIYGYSQYNFQKRKARIMSPYASPQKRSSCLEFWYHMYGRNAESLKVFIQKEGQQIPTAHVWKESGDHGDFWHRATVDINVISTRFRVVFEAITGTTHQNDVAIDDVTFHNSTSCPPFVTEPPPAATLPPMSPNASCSFEDPDICGYTQVINDNYDWSHRHGSRWAGYYRYRSYRFRYDTGPTADHTLGTDSGYYMNFDCTYNSYRVKFDYRAQLATPYLEPHSEPRCMHFYYHMYGKGVDYLQLYVVPFGYTLSIDSQWIAYGNKGNEWQHGTLHLPPSTDTYRVFFEASRGLSSRSCDIAIDDVIFVDGACPEDPKPTPQPSAVGSCDFEATDDPLCGYVQVPHWTEREWLMDKWNSRISDSFDWALNTGNTSTDKTGPSIDTTLGTAKGHYMYIESSVPNRPNLGAFLLSPVIDFHDSQENMCLQFSYHMKGEGIGRLEVNQRTMTGTKKLKTLMGDNGDDWQAIMIDIESFTLGPNVKPQFQLVFKGFVGMAPYGDIAIDDILVMDHPCGGHQKESICTFDTFGDWCGYYQRFQQNDLKWRQYGVNKLNTQSIDVQGDGSYLYLTSTGPTEFMKAFLSSHTIDGSPHQWHDHCVEFDYFIQRNSSETKLTVAVSEHSYEYNTIWSVLDGSDGNGWKHFRKTLSADLTKNYFKIWFLGVLGKYSDVIGLDNPTITLGSCEADGTNHTLQNTAPLITYKYTTDPLAVFFSILSAVLIIICIGFLLMHLHRKYRGKLSALSVRYLYHKDEDKVRLDDSGKAGNSDSNLTIENPLYGAAPAVMISTDLTLTNGTNPINSVCDLKQ